MSPELIISGLLELFVLILLILAVSKLSAIHKALQPKTTAFEDYNKHEFFQNDKASLEALKDAYWLT